ncbi:MAG: sulfite exporter TauE/SafE family protein, partial [Alphaproteobacteria bacterium]|nr:sulfite exporter TauE/SafE family protein [Alphaproteobacteria bacterium]
GMGLPTVAVGVLGALFSPLTAASLLLVPSFITNLWQSLAGPHRQTLIGRLWPMLAATVAGTLAASARLAAGGTRTATVTLGLALILYAASALFARPWRVPARAERWLAPLAGFVTGVVAGATGVLVVPAAPYLQALGLDREALVQALGLSFTASTLALGAGLVLHGALPAGAVGTSALAVLPALAGMGVGQAVRSRISATAFRQWFLLCLLLLGLAMVAHGQS